MFCRNCGTQLNDGDAFCPNCGTPNLVQEVSETGRTTQRESTPVTAQAQQDANHAYTSSPTPNGSFAQRKSYVLLCCIAILALAGMAIAFLAGKRATNENMPVASDAAAESQIPPSPIVEPTEEQRPTDAPAESSPSEESINTQPPVVSSDGIDAGSSNPDSAFRINADTIENYAANLDPYTFLTYHSQISDFYFSYPAYLYNMVAYSEEPVENSYGINLQSIDFKGSNGSELIFQISRRTDNHSIEQMTNYVFNMQTSLLSEAVTLQHNSEADYGKVIMTGYDSTYTYSVYYMAKIEPDYVLQMIVVFPIYVSSDDKLQKDYITECLYRMCGFSGSSAPVESYEDYCVYWEEHL